MSIASALRVGNEPLPELAVEALRLALEKIGQSYANGVLLFLTADFARHAQQALSAVARAARCTQVVGGIAGGVFTESGWVLDRPAAAVLVFAGEHALGHPQAAAGIGEALLSYAGGSFPPAWSEAGVRRVGGSFSGLLGSSEAVAWQQGRRTAQCSVPLLGMHVDIGVSRGWRLLGDACRVDSSRAYELLTLGGETAFESLQRGLPRDFQTPLPLASLCAVLIDDEDTGSDRQRAFAEGAGHPIAILAVNADQSITLAERLFPGQQLAWAMRTPRLVAADMRRSVADLAATTRDPVAAVVFSCSGRGPCFYAGEDRDLDCLRARFPGLPLLGSYGTGQIAPRPAGGNQLLQNAVVIALISSVARPADV